MPREDSSRTSNSASQMIDQRIRDLGDWRRSALKRMRELIHEADPEVVEEWKWAKATSPGTPVWSHNGGICTGESYKQVVKLTFFQGASLRDPAHLFNSSLEGNTRRAIDIHEDDAITRARQPAHDVVLRVLMVIPPVFAAKADYGLVSNHRKRMTALSVNQTR